MQDECKVSVFGGRHGKFFLPIRDISPRCGNNSSIMNGFLAGTFGSEESALLPPSHHCDQGRARLNHSMCAVCADHPPKVATIASAPVVCGRRFGSPLRNAPVCRGHI